MSEIQDDSDGLLSAFRSGDFGGAHFDDLRPISVISDMLFERCGAAGDTYGLPDQNRHSTPSFSTLLELAQKIEHCCMNFVNTDYDYQKSFYLEFPKFWTVDDIRTSDHPMNRFPWPGSTEATENALESYRCLLGDMYYWLKKCQLIRAPKVVIGKSHHIENRGTSEHPDYMWETFENDPPEEIGDWRSTFYEYRTGVDDFRFCQGDGPVYGRTIDLTNVFMYSEMAVSNGLHVPVAFFPVWRFVGGIDYIYQERILYGGLEVGGDGTMSHAPGRFSCKNTDWWMGEWNDSNFRFSLTAGVDISVSGSQDSPEGDEKTFLNIVDVQKNDEQADDGDSKKEVVTIYSPDWKQSREIDGLGWVIADQKWEDEYMGGPGDHTTVRVEDTRRYSVSTTCSALVPGPGPDLLRRTIIPANSSEIVVPEISSLPLVARPAIPDVQPKPTDKYPIAGVLFESIVSEGPYSVFFVGEVGPLFTIPSYPLQTPFA